MGLPSGHNIPLSPARRFICDLMHASRSVPLVSVERTISIGELIAARKASPNRPSWFAIFLKAYSIVCDRLPELRRSYLTFPYHRLHQHTCNVANLAIARRIGDEDAVLAIQIRHPEQMTLDAISNRVQRARTDPIESFGEYRRLMSISRLPQFARRFLWWMAMSVSGHLRAQYYGTFGVTGVAAIGATSLHTLSPLTTTITYGIFEADGRVVTRIFYDHRVLDGSPPAKALVELERVLQTEMVHELRGESKAAA